MTYQACGFASHVKNANPSGIFPSNTFFRKALAETCVPPFSRPTTFAVRASSEEEKESEDDPRGYLERPSNDERVPTAPCERQGFVGGHCLESTRRIAVGSAFADLARSVARLRREAPSPKNGASASEATASRANFARTREHKPERKRSEAEVEGRGEHAQHQEHDARHGKRNMPLVKPQPPKKFFRRFHHEPPTTRRSNPPPPLPRGSGERRRSPEVAATPPAAERSP